MIVEFGFSQFIDAPCEAAYRLIPKAALVGEADKGAMRIGFLALVTDKNPGAQVSAETAGVRDVLLAVAFGALARECEASGSS